MMMKVEQPKLKNKIAAHEIVQLSTNRIPKGLVPLERLFDNNDVAVKLQTAEKESDVSNIMWPMNKTPDMSIWPPICLTNKRTIMVNC
jgi:hypothetical protein